jgi:hypothetical protein
MVVASILTGGVTAKLGYYVPAMIVSPSLMAVGQGLMSTFSVNETSAHWIGFQFLTGFGLGVGMQAAGLAAQTVLPKPDVPTGISIMFFSQQLGGAIFTSVGQNLLSTWLTSNLSGFDGVDPSGVVNQGAGDIINRLRPEDQPRMREIYNHAISRIFLCAMGVAIAAVIAALFMEWKNIKKVKAPGAAGANSARALHGNIPPLAGRGQAPAVVDQGDLVKPASSSGEGTKQAGVVPVEKAGCEHCEHCRLSRAVTLAPSEQMSRLSNISNSPSNLTIPVNQLNRLSGLGEAARLAAIARDAVAQLEELTRPYSVMSTATSRPLVSVTSQPVHPLENPIPATEASSQQNTVCATTPVTPVLRDRTAADSTESFHLSNLPSPSQITTNER